MSTTVQQHRYGYVKVGVRPTDTGLPPQVRGIEGSTYLSILSLVSQLFPSADDAEGKVAAVSSAQEPTAAIG